MRNTHLGRGTKAKLAAMNPVARALAMDVLRRAATESKARCYSMHEGEVDEKHIQSSARFFTVVLLACETDKLAERDDYNFKELIALMDQGLLKLVKMSDNGYRWEYSQAHDIVDAIDAALLLTPKLSPQAVNKAWHQTEHLK
jgi:hypothetical protein